MDLTQEDGTFIEKLNSNEELLQAMLSMPTRMNEQLPRMRREEMFSFLWEHTDMERHEAMTLVNKRELDFVREYEHIDLPEWILRCEAQDVLMEVMHERFEEEELL